MRRALCRAIFVSLSSAKAKSKLWVLSATSSAAPSSSGELRSIAYSGVGVRYQLTFLSVQSQRGNCLLEPLLSRPGSRRRGSQIIIIIVIMIMIIIIIILNSHL